MTDNESYLMWSVRNAMKPSWSITDIANHGRRRAERSIRWSLRAMGPDAAPEHFGKWAAEYPADDCDMTGRITQLPLIPIKEVPISGDTIAILAIVHSLSWYIAQLHRVPLFNVRIVGFNWASEQS